MLKWSPRFYSGSDSDSITNIMRSRFNSSARCSQPSKLAQTAAFSILPSIIISIITLKMGAGM